MKVAAYKTRTRCFGKSIKFVLWLQGCPRSCPGCMAPEWQQMDGGQERSVESIQSMVSEAQVEGIVISGGDPLLQYEELCELLDCLKRNGFGIIVYTGFTEDDVKSKFPAILTLADILIPGPYVEGHNDGRGLRGSANQPVIFLSGKYLDEKDFFNSGERIIEIEVENEFMAICGIPPTGMVDI